MKITSFEEFKELAGRGTFVPVVKEMVADLLTPVSAFLKIAEDADYAFLLESVEGGEHVGRYSFLGKDPFLILRARGSRTIDGSRRRDDRKRSAVHRDAAAAHGRLPVPVRVRAAALHRRRGGLSRATARHPGSSRSSAISARAPTGPTTPASCCSIRCSPSITCSTGFCSSRTPASPPTTISSRSISSRARRFSFSSASSSAACRMPAPTRRPAGAALESHARAVRGTGADGQGRTSRRATSTRSCCRSGSRPR